MDPIILLVVVVVILVIVGAVFFLLRGGGDRATEDRLIEFVQGIEDEPAEKKGKKGKEAGRKRIDTTSFDEALEERGFGQKIRTQLAQANLKITPTEFILMNILSIIITAALAFVIYRNIPLALAGAVLGFFLPRIYLGMRRRKRIRMFNDQLGDTITLMANGLRSGYSVLQAMESVGKEMPDPIAEEFRRVVREVQLGVSNERALNNMVRRVPSDDLDLMITAVNVQSEVGGNLAEILEIIGFVIRERVRIQGEIKTLTAQGMMGGYIISFLPIVLGLILFAMNQEYLGRMIFPCPEGGISCASQPCGWIMTGVGLFLIAIGFFAVQKIVRIEV